MLNQIKNASPLLIWPLLCWIFRKVVDSYYGIWVRRDERYLSELYEQQIKHLKSIEDDPEFKRNMELLAKYGKHVPSYAAPVTPQKPAAQQTHAKQRSMPPDKAASTSIPSKLDKSAEEPKTPISYTPKSGKVYTQPVQKTPIRRVALPPPTVTPSKSMFQSVIDVIVGDAPVLSVTLQCAQCGANNGLVSKENVPREFECKVCHFENGSVKRESADKKND